MFLRCVTSPRTTVEQTLILARKFDFHSVSYLMTPINKTTLNAEYSARGDEGRRPDVRGGVRLRVAMSRGERLLPRSVSA